MSTPEKDGKRPRGDIVSEENQMGWFPEVTEYGYLLDWLMELGPCVDGQLISWSDFKAWCELAGHRPMGWEIDVLRQLSIVFVNKVHEFRNVHTPSPYALANSDEVDTSEWMKSILKQEREA